MGQRKMTDFETFAAFCVAHACFFYTFVQKDQGWSCNGRAGLWLLVSGHWSGGPYILRVNQDEEEMRAMLLHYRSATN